MAESPGAGVATGATENIDDPDRDALLNEWVTESSLPRRWQRLSLSPARVRSWSRSRGLLQITTIRNNICSEQHRG